MNLTTIPRNEVGQNQWDGFAKTSDEAWLWHLWDYREPEDFLIPKTDLSFAVIGDRGQIVLIMPLLLTPRRVARIIPAKSICSIGGPAAMNGLSQKQRVKLHEYLRQELSRLATLHGAIQLDIAIPPMAPAYRGANCPRVNPLLTLGCENTQSQTWVVDLRQTEQELR